MCFGGEGVRLHMIQDHPICTHLDRHPLGELENIDSFTLFSYHQITLVLMGTKRGWIYAAKGEGTERT